jgi:hypothetical protein
MKHSTRSDGFSRRKAATYILCVVIVTLGLPAAAIGVVSGSNVFVTDTTTGTRAHVDKYGSLSVATSQGTPFTETCSGVVSDTVLNNRPCTFSIPSGATFWITGISVSAVGPPNSVESASLRYDNSTSPCHYSCAAYFNLPVTGTYPTGVTHYNTYQPLQIAAPGGSTVTSGISKPQGLADVSWTASVSGYLR